MIDAKVQSNKPMTDTEIVEYVLGFMRTTPAPQQITVYCPTCRSRKISPVCVTCAVHHIYDI